MPPTATEEPNAETDDNPEADNPEPDEGGDGLLGDADTDVDDDGGDSQYDSLPDHMIDDDGKIDTKELYKSYQGLVQQVPDADVSPADVIGDNGQVDVDTLMEQRSKLRKELSQQDSDDETEEEDSDEEPTQEGEIPESPEGYDLDDEAAEELGIDKESQAFEVLKEAAHESDLNTEQFDNFVSTYLSKFNEQGVNRVDIEEEKSKLADDPETAEAMINEARQWVDGLYQQGKLDKAEHDAMLQIGNRAEGVRTIIKLRNEVGLTEQIPEGNPVGDGSVSWSEIEKMMEDERYQNGDPEYDAKVREKIAQYNAERS